MGFTTDLLVGVAELIGSTTSAVWSPGGAYDASDIGIVLGDPTESPDSLVALATYGDNDDVALSDSEPRIQVRLRAPGADTRDVVDIADEIFDALHGFRGSVNGIRVVYAKRISSFPLGRDANGRHERSDNYVLSVHRPSTYRE